MEKLLNIFNAQQIDALKHVQNSINDILSPAGYETYIDDEHIKLLEGMPELRNVPLNIRPSKQTDLVLINSVNYSEKLQGLITEALKDLKNAKYLFNGGRYNTTSCVVYFDE